MRNYKILAAMAGPFWLSNPPPPHLTRLLQLCLHLLYSLAGLG